jgi:RNA polymerase sigma-70 factor (ECF subfamily)
MLLEACQTIPDDEVINRVRSGEIGLYEMLMRRYNQRLYRLIRSIVNDELEAEDVLQEAWVRAYEHLGQFEGRATFATWLSRIAFHEALARVRKSKRWTQLDEPHAAQRRTTKDTPEQQAMRSQLSVVIQNAVDALPETYRTVFILRDVENLSTTETAECLNLSEEAVKTRLHRSRALLRRELQSQIGPALIEAYTFLGSRCDRIVKRVLSRIG